MEIAIGALSGPLRGTQPIKSSVLAETVTATRIIDLISVIWAIRIVTVVETCGLFEPILTRPAPKNSVIR